MSVEKESRNASFYMQRAMELAAIAEEEGEVPVGAVIVLDGEIIGEGWNRSIGAHDATAHAEMMAIKQAGSKIENYRLVDATLYVTLEPCPMCAGAIVHSRIKRVIFGASDMKTGASGSVINLFTSATAFHFVECESGVMEDACRSQLQAFFKRRRKEKKEEKKARREAGENNVK
ncbi:tRNA adenosine(34) deaminase TadA [Aliivibrio fischeri]|uniref:tRNA adenosine(34) deaminase TadA n=1 Tax=Aliivibrio fischeri TaxID=668 RepID=UPI0012DA4373|nr:tRNA adenosine(34) deaminase TadA [Aliivibrio fischeri]MUK71018.1 tRNA adenosine(34) deaminase TadA [Aliivibrio fischeri]MUK74335.1 tRNA adenosine(34) deaminase TadA [Aliivibrio fischeri]